MKTSLTALLLLFFIACQNDSHLHDGLYVRGLGVTKGIENEVLKVVGGEIYSRRYDYHGKYLGEMKVICQQLPDRIEYTDLGQVHVLTVMPDQSLKLSDDVIFARYANADDSFDIKETPGKPLVIDNGDGTYRVNMPEKSKKSKDEIFQGKRIFTDENQSWKIVIEISNKSALISTYYGDKNDLATTKKAVSIDSCYIKKNSFYAIDGSGEVGFLKNGNYCHANNEGGINDYHQVEP